jgi:hypothetical protein
VLADGRIDAAADAEAVAFHDLLVEGLAHAVQALELEARLLPANSSTAAMVWALWVANWG